MIIEKEYKFYAAHRNEELTDKCRNLHGHRYNVRFRFEVKRTSSYSTLFSEFDQKIEPLLKEEYDHGMLINIHDPLYDTLVDHMARTGETLKLKTFSRPTSVENLAHQLFSEVLAMGFCLNEIELRETDTSVLVYNRQDWLQDERRFAEQKLAVPPRVAANVSLSPSGLENELA